MAIKFALLLVVRSNLWQTAETARRTLEKSRSSEVEVIAHIVAIAVLSFLSIDIVPGVFWGRSDVLG